MSSTHREVGGNLVVQVGPGALDRPRIAAREAAYANSTDEARMIAAMDEAAFDRVRTLERNLIAQANDLHDNVAGSPTVHGSAERSVMGRVDAVVDEIYDIVRELERGASAAAVAERFEAVRQRAEHVVRPELGRARSSIAYYRERLADPYSAAQRVISILPRSVFRPVDPSPYLD